MEEILITVGCDFVHCNKINDHLSPGYASEDPAGPQTPLWELVC